MLCDGQKFFSVDSLTPARAIAVEMSMRCAPAWHDSFVNLIGAALAGAALRQRRRHNGHRRAAACCQSPLVAPRFNPRRKAAGSITDRLASVSAYRTAVRQ